MGTQRLDFAEFYSRFKNECLLTVLVQCGDHDTAQELVAETFARAWASWPKVGRHPAPAAWSSHGAERQYFAVAAPPP